MEQRLQEAYAKGDTDLIMRLIGGGEADETESDTTGSNGGRADKVSLHGSTSVKGGALDPSATEFTPSALALPVPNDSATPDPSSDEDPALTSLLAIFPHAQFSTVSALLWAHGGNSEAAQVSLHELDEIGELDRVLPEGAESTGPSAVDTQAYAAAVAHFDSEFPSLGGAPSGPVVGRKDARSDAYSDGKLIGKMRQRGLAERMGWIDAEAVARVYRSCGGNSAATEARLLELYPKPATWEATKSARARDAIRDACVRATASLSVDDHDGGREGVGDRDTENSKWVRTGSAVSRLYSEKRAEASEEARQRNKLFERAAAAARAGNGAEAGRIGALGRASNVRLHRLHEDAAELLWTEQNPDFVKEGLVDLHGLHVKEALNRLPDALSEAAAGGRTSISVVFGTGHHSVGGHGAPRLRPAVLAFLDAEGYAYREVQDAKTKHVGAVSVDCRISGPR